MEKKKQGRRWSCFPHESLHRGLEAGVQLVNIMNTCGFIQNTERNTKKKMLHNRLLRTARQSCNSYRQILAENSRIVHNNHHRIAQSVTSSRNFHRLPAGIDSTIHNNNRSSSITASSVGIVRHFHRNVLDRSLRNNDFEENDDHDDFSSSEERTTSNALDPLEEIMLERTSLTPKEVVEELNKHIVGQVS